MKKVWFLVLGIAALLFLAACSTGEAGAKSRVCAQVSNCEFATADDIAELKNEINALSEKKLECKPTIAISNKEMLGAWGHPETANDLCSTLGKEAVAVLMSKKPTTITTSTSGEGLTGGWEIVNGFYPSKAAWNFDIDKGLVYHVVCCSLG